MKGIILLFTAFMFALCVNAHTSGVGKPPKLFTWDGEALFRLRETIRLKPKKLTFTHLTSLKHLQNSALTWSNRTKHHNFPKVTDKTSLPPNATSNHFVSLVPYAHPCTNLPPNCKGYDGSPAPSTCDKNTGLPWAICDDELNIYARDHLTDRYNLDNIMHAIVRLSLSAYLFRSHQFAASAVTLLDAWFVDKQTRMLPSLEFAQGVPGLINGKPSGCIDFSYFGRSFADAILLLRQTPEATTWTTTKDKVFKTWCSDMAMQMVSHKIISKESKMRNNHGIFYDLTVLSLFMLSKTNKKYLRQYLSPTCTGYMKCWRGRLDDQADSTGLQIHEAHRKGYGHYVWYTLLAHAHLFEMGRAAGAEMEYRNSTMSRISGWTKTHFDELSDSGREWMAYGVQAYRILGRISRDTWFEEAACKMLKTMGAQRKRMKRNWRAYIWSDDRIGIDVWNLAFPSEMQCDIWKDFQKVSLYELKHIEGHNEMSHHHPLPLNSQAMKFTRRVRTDSHEVPVEMAQFTWIGFDTLVLIPIIWSVLALALEAKRAFRSKNALPVQDRIRFERNRLHRWGWKYQLPTWNPINMKFTKNT